MNPQEEKYFHGIVEQRSGFAKFIKMSFAKNLRYGVVDKYSDSAHFIYELLQNADDTGATKARFILKRDRLIFVHNGQRSFSISDPENEDYDRENGQLGDLNAITSIGQSSKGEPQTGNAPKIGKFGLGFKWESRLCCLSEGSHHPCGCILLDL